MKQLKVISLLLLSLLLNYCVRGRVARYPGYSYRSTNPNYIQIYYMPPTVSFEIIGEVESAGAPLASWGRVENSMRKKAGSIGGDAVILISKRSPYVGTYTTPATGNAFVYGNYIYYTYQPGTSYAMRGKHIIGLVIKWKSTKKEAFPLRKSNLSIDEKIEQEIEPIDAKIFLKDGTLLTAKILSEDKQKINIETSIGKFIVEWKDILTIEKPKRKAEERDVKIYLRDGTILKAKILNQDEQKIDIKTSLGKLNIERINILKIEQVKEKKAINEGDLVPLGSVDVAPVLVKSVTPKYNWRKFYSGSVKFIVRVLISESGDIESAEIVGGAQTYAAIRKVIIKAVKQWKFKPALKDGVKVKVWKEVAIRINIDETLSSLDFTSDSRNFVLP